MKSIQINLSIFLALIITTAYSEADKFAALRNPFMPLSQSDCKNTRNQKISLEGIVYMGTKRSAAILARAGQREVVQRGMRFGGYQLVTIGKKFVVLVRGSKRKRLQID